MVYIRVNKSRNNYRGLFKILKGVSSVCVENNLNKDIWGIKVYDNIYQSENMKEYEKNDRFPLF